MRKKSDNWDVNRWKQSNYLVLNIAIIKHHVANQPYTKKERYFVFISNFELITHYYIVWWKILSELVFPFWEIGHANGI